MTQTKEKKTVKPPKNKNISPQEQLKSKALPRGIATVYKRAVRGEEKQETERCHGKQAHWEPADCSPSPAGFYCTAWAPDLMTSSVTVCSSTGKHHTSRLWVRHSSWLPLEGLSEGSISVNVWSTWSDRVLLSIHPFICLLSTYHFYSSFPCT